MNTIIVYRLELCYIAVLRRIVNIHFFLLTLRIQFILSFCTQNILSTKHLMIFPHTVPDCEHSEKCTDFTIMCFPFCFSVNTFHTINVKSVLALT